jgi:DNA-binding PucR family transcriptional regulator
MAADPKSWREVLLEAGLEVGVDGLVDVAADALAQGLPVLRDDADLRDAARRSAAANVQLLLAIVQDQGDLDDIEPPPAAMAFARELARRHVPVSELGRAYRVAQHAMWQWAVDEIRARMADPAAVATAVEELSDAAFRTGDIFSTLVMERYATEREQWMRSGEAVRRAAVTELLGGGRTDAATMSRRLGYELRGEHQAFVVWADGDDASPATRAAAIGGPRALVVPLGDGLVAGWAPPAAIAADGDGGEETVGSRLALGSPGRGVAGFRASHHQATEARRVARLIGGTGGGPPVHHRDVALLALLTQDLAQARAFVADTLGPLAQDDETARRLATTLHALLEEHGSPRRAGRRLGIHENTVAKRQAAIDRALPPERRAGAAELLAALVLREALGVGEGTAG